MPKLTHPQSEQTIETANPEPYLSQGWVKAAPDKPNTNTKAAK